MKHWRGIAQAFACASLLAASAHPSAQVQWTTALNPSQPLALAWSEPFAASAADGSVITVGFASDGEAVRPRISRLFSSGTRQWSRWAGEVTADATYLRQPLLHADSSVTVSYIQGGLHCIENFAADGTRRLRTCPGSAQAAAARLTLTPDDEILYAAGAPTRTLLKLAPQGTLRWSATAYYVAANENAAVGFDSAGNYVEIFTLSTTVWDATVGQSIATFTLPQSFRTNGLPWNSELTMRSGRDMVLLRDANLVGTVQNVAVGRFSATGTLRWSVNLSLPGGSGPQSTFRLHPADNDGIYVVRSSNELGGDSEVVKLSAAGTVVWRRHYAAVHRLLVTPAGLSGIRTDSAAAETHSYVFPIAAGSGALGSAMIYSRNDSAVPTAWFALQGAVLAGFAGQTAAADPELAFKQIYLSTASASRWVYVDKIAPAVSVRQESCLMPRLALSSPHGRWARTQAVPGDNAPGQWTAVASDGTVAGKTAVPAVGCGPAAMDDDSRIVIALTPRAQRITAAGAVAWTATGALTPSSPEAPPVQTFAAGGDTVYQTGNVVGRVSASGTIVFETALASGLRAGFLAVEADGHLWSVAAPESPTTASVSRLSPTGTVLWTTTLSNQGCGQEVNAARRAESGHLIVSTRDFCFGTSRIYRIGNDGAIAWERSVEHSRLRSLAFDAAGNVFAGGCRVSGIVPDRSSDTTPTVVSWSPAGNERWSTLGNLIGGVTSCVSSIAADPAGKVYATVSPYLTTTSSREPALWALSVTGAEQWQSRLALSAPFAQHAELLIEASGRLIVLGEAPPDAATPRSSTLRALDPAGIASGLTLRVLAAPTQPIGFRAAFTISVGMVDGGNAPAVRNVDTVAWLSLATGQGNLDGPLQCVIPAGASSCQITGSRYDLVESNVVLRIAAEGFASVTTTAFNFVAAATAVQIAPLFAGPYSAYSLVRFRATLDAPPPPPPGTSPTSHLNPLAYLADPRPNSPGGVGYCNHSTSLGGVPFNDCDLLVRAAMLPLAAEFWPDSNAAPFYLASTGSLTALPYSKSATLLQATADPDNSLIAGDRVRVRVALLAATTGFNTTPFTARSLRINGGTCTPGVTSGSVYTGLAGSYAVCEVPAVAAGNHAFTVGFDGDDDLLPATDAVVNLTVAAGAVFARISSAWIGGATACSTTPGVTCRVTGYPQPSLQCVGPSGMSGQVFLVPTDTGSSSTFRYVQLPLNFNNVTGIDRQSIEVTVKSVFGACVLDVDRDGALMPFTDGLLILRAMLGLSGDALMNHATHSCVARDATAVRNAINLSAFDLDGDGATLPHTDGVLLLRVLLGIGGDALTQNAIGAGATRVTASAIRDYLTNTCRL